MAFPDNTSSCGCETDDCGCKTNANTVVYIGPPLPCSGVTNCDTISEIIVKFDELLCSDAFIQTLITNITNTPELFSQFVTIVNNSIDCDVVINCVTTTTTIVPTTTTTTTSCGGCDRWDWFAAGVNNSSMVYVDCIDEKVVILSVEAVTNNNGVICVQQGQIPKWLPVPTEGTHQLSFTGCCGDTNYKLPLQTSAYASLALACAGVFEADINIYVEQETPVNGNFVYLDDALTTVFDGSDKFYLVKKIDLSFVAIQVSSLGEILTNSNC